MFMKDLFDKLNEEKTIYTYELSECIVDEIKTKKHKNTLIYKKEKMIK